MYTVQASIVGLASAFDVRKTFLKKALDSVHVYFKMISLRGMCVLLKSTIDKRVRLYHILCLAPFEKYGPIVGLRNKT